MPTASNVQLPAALQRRRRRVIDESGEGPNEDGVLVDTQTPPPPAADKTPPPTAAAPAAEPDEDEDEDEDEGDDEQLSAGGVGDLLAFLDDAPATPAPPAAPAPDPNLTAERQRLQEEREAFAAERRQFQEERERAEAAKAPAGLKVPDIDEKTAAHYKGSASFVAHTALAAVAEQINPMLEKLSARIAQLEATSTEVRQHATSAAETVRTDVDRRFNEALRASFGDVRELMRNKRLAKFLARSLQYSPDKTLRDAFKEATDRRDAATVSRILNAFVKSEEAAGRTVDALQAGRHTQSAQNQLPGRKASGKLPWSARTKAWDDRRSGVISAEEFEEIKARYMKAEEAGNVDYNA